MSDESTFGERLRAHRRRADLTQEELAELAGCAVTTLRAIEVGRRRPSREMAQRLADVLRLDDQERPRFLRLARAAPTAAGGAPRAPGPSGPPPLPPGQIARPQLTEQLAALDDGMVALLAAPPGFAKTTTLRLWARQQARPILWLALTAADDGPAPLLRALWAAAGQPSQEPVSPERLLAALAGLPRGAALVLDDYQQLADPAAHRLVATLIERLPQLRLLIASRADPPLPLSRMRAQGRLVELRAADLRFTPAEAAAVLRETHRLSLSDAQLGRLMARTEGWPAGLRLAALSLRGLPPDEVDAFLDSFGGTSRFVGEYLGDEVLRRLPAHLRAFLLQTAILERLSPALCDALIGVDAPQVGVSRLLLDELERANLFLQPLDGPRGWYRYHSLFAELLRARLAQDALPAQVAALHRRAAAWLLAHGEQAAAEGHQARADQLDPPLPGALLPAGAPLIGRAAELAQLAALCADQQTRLVTLVGPGGIGKTRLAAEAAGELGPSFSGGAVFVPLEQVGDPAQLPAALLTALGVAPGDNPHARLLGAAREREQLLVLDNFEQLLPAAGLIAELLAAAARIRILVTSREPLRLGAETVLELRGLGCAGDDDAAARLFRERVRRLRPGWAPTAGEQAAILAICRAVEGMPLAIELAAAWSDVLPLPELAAELLRSLDLLERHSPDLPERHRSLRAVFEQSWARLEPALRPILARLALFPASFARDAAARVAGAGLPQLATLLRQSLVRRDGDRYALHPTIRAFALERLAEQRLGEEAEGRYVAHYGALAAEAGQGYRGAAQQYWLTWFPTEARNWARALELALKRADLEAAVDLSVQLGPLWRLHGMAGEALALAERALAHPALAAARRPALLVAISHLAQHACEWRRAAQAARGALALPQTQADPLLRAGAGVALAAALIVLHQPEAALPLLEESLAVFRAAGQPYEVVRALQNLADGRLGRGDLSGAQAALHELLGIAQAAGLIQYALGAQVFLAELALLRGDLAAVPECLGALPGLAQLGDLHVICFGIEVLAAYSGRRGCPDAGARLLGLVTALREAIDEPVRPNFAALTAGYQADARGALAPAVAAALEAEGAAAVRRGPDGAIQIEPLLAFVRAQLARTPQPAPAPPAAAVGGAGIAEAGGEPLTDREREVLQLLAEGASNQEIAGRLAIALGTVKRHLNTIFAKLGAQSRTQAVARARRLGLLVDG